jgi:SsrA-binding protein
MGSFYNHEPKRNRKLLLTKKELRKLQIKTQDKGMTIVPLQIFFNERGFAKMEIALAQGKKLHDKRDTMKERDAKIEISRYNK